MQLHEEPSSENSLPVSQHRIRPEELTRALATIEARRQEAARRQEEEDRYLAETIPVEEAVRDLHLEVTPEEIWAEVQAQREQNEENKIPDQEEELYVISPSSEPIQVTNPVFSHRWLRKKLYAKLPAAFVLAALFIGIAARHPVHWLSSQPAGNHPTSSSSFLTAATYPDKIPFQLCSLDAVKLLSKGDTSTVPIPPEPIFGKQPYPHGWEFIKYNGFIYLRGWVAAPPMGRSFPHPFLELYNCIRPEIGFRPAVVTLRVDQLQFSNFYQRIDMMNDSPSGVSVGDEKIIVSDVHLDEHAWELCPVVTKTNEPTLLFESYKISPLQVSLNAQRKKAAEKLLMRGKGPLLSKMANDIPFEMDANNLCCLISGISPSKIHRSPSRILTATSNDGGAWRLIKHNGETYLRGWIASDADIHSHFLHLYNFPTAPEIGASPRQITLCLSSFHFGPYGEVYSLPFDDWTGKTPKIRPSGEIYNGADYQQIVLSDIHLDNHAYEKWQP